MQRREQAIVVDPDLMVVGVEALRDQVGVAELVALATPGGREADAEGLKPALPGLGEQGDDQARVQAA